MEHIIDNPALRKCINPNSGFVKQLKKYDEQLLNPNMNEEKIPEANDNKPEKYNVVTNVCQICGYTDYHDLDSHPLSHITPIMPRLYLGSRTNAHNYYEVKFFDIKTIINVAIEIPKICADEFKYIKYDWDDIFCFDILSDLDNIVDQIHFEISNENPVLVHCAAGVSRSASAVIGYLMKYEKMSFDDAYKHVKSLRSCINPNSGFVDQLKKYGTKLSSTNV